MQDLVQEGFPRTIRSRNGGIVLALPAHKIRLGQVLRRMQADLDRAVHASDGVSSARTETFSALFLAAEDEFLAFMDRFSVAGLDYEVPIKQIDCPINQPVSVHLQGKLKGNRTVIRRLHQAPQ